MRNDLINNSLSVVNKDWYKEWKSIECEFTKYCKGKSLKTYSEIKKDIIKIAEGKSLDELEELKEKFHIVTETTNVGKDAYSTMASTVVSMVFGVMLGVSFANFNQMIAQALLFGVMVAVVVVVFIFHSFSFGYGKIFADHMVEILSEVIESKKVNTQQKEEESNTHQTETD